MDANFQAKKCNEKIFFTHPHRSDDRAYLQTLWVGINKYLI